MLVLTLCVVAPAGARIAGKHPPGDVRRPDPFIAEGRASGPSVGKDVRQIRKQVDRARESGALTPREARRLKREARLIGRHARLFARDGLSESERRELEARSFYLRDAVSRARHDGPSSSGKR
jgi:hypothetical protein